MEAADVIQIVLLVLVLFSSVSFPLLIYMRVTKSLRGEVSRMTGRLDQNLGAGAKLLEVRDYYQQTSSALKKMLDDAYKEGNRSRQEEIRRLLDRLETLKARALDKSVAILDAKDGASGSRRRRSRRPRGGRRKRPDNGGNKLSNSDGKRPRNSGEKKA